MNTREKVRYKVTMVSLPANNEKAVAVTAVCTNSPEAPKWLPRMLEFEMTGTEGRPRFVPQVMGYVEATIDLFPDEDRIGYDRDMREVLAKHGVPAGNLDDVVTALLRILKRADALR